ncbi:RelA/SpoT domain-containing protein [Pseudomonas sp. 148P]|uniref:RelA/SpoT domain-containing protein n=1 Tax=Pseudomonas ulcerans TaxID=3115852 RepID=A0ABU7HL31_9PSED|nr:MULTISPECIES: RelA/SpoT domain-containing protein [unclassified Pseudomonas]MEE1920855.1 RelA/SpoT domain-containing protein [Pseudomonas sp. 147P]MEE1932244.1 RelA/SpoT domain-containing protein [Pseudomonas sp. 148P]
MDQVSFLEMLGRKDPELRRWGLYISETLSDALKQKGYPDCFIKIPVVPRVKTLDSARGKLVRKGYTDPLRQMTDLVGVRFVVLLTEEIEILSKLVESCTAWQASVARDHLEERSTNTKVFDYQSKHYEIRPTAETMALLALDHSFCCELQIRTLLQHAYAEMVHDNLYKPTGSVPPMAERHVARSMALIETTDEIFSTTMELLAKANEPRESFKRQLKIEYERSLDIAPHSSNTKIENLILDSFQELVNDESLQAITELLRLKPYIKNKIKVRLDQPLLFRERIIFFIYQLVSTIPYEELCERWPLAGDWRSLELVKADLNA